MPKAQAEVLAEQHAPDARATAATLASLTFPLGIYVNGQQGVARDAWIVTLDYPYPIAMPTGCVAILLKPGQKPSHSPQQCPPFVISKDIVYIDARTGTGAIFLSTN